ncbi:hypothetical protein FACS189419_08870 [Planctomycetales bacterium]|nr:hypothetical protein FACS189419_08870 [Planctomycetales bacterium]
MEQTASAAKGDASALLQQLDNYENVSKNIFKNGWWGQGGYFSPVKLSLFIAVFLLWVACASWANSDQERLKISNRETFNLFYVGLFCLAAPPVLLIPVFWVAFPITALLWLIPILLYVTHRNKRLPPAEKVLTGEHLYFLFAVAMGKIGIKMAAQKRLSYAGGPPIELEPAGRGIDDQALTGRLILARNDPGYNLFRENLYEALKSRATAMMFDFTPSQTTVRHQVDGTWLELEAIAHRPGRSRDKDAYEEMLESAKKLVGGNPEDRQSRQSGKFRILFGKKSKSKKAKKPVKYDVDFLSQGTKTGEGLLLQFHSQMVPFQTLEELGMRAELQPQVVGELNNQKGFFLVSAPVGNGLRSTFSVLQRVCDRFTRDVCNIEDVNDPSEAVENIIHSDYDSSKGETAMKVLPDLLFKGISVVYIRDIADNDVFQLCLDESDEGRKFITTVRAKDGVEALLQLISNSPIPASSIVPRIGAVMCQRLVRTLCPDCREVYQPDANLLKQLGLRPEQVQQLFRKRTPLPPYEERKRGICPTCNGVGYRGRKGLFEYIKLSDETKSMLLSNPDPKRIRQQLNKEKQTGFLYEGIYLLLAGETTVEELATVMKM